MAGRWWIQLLAPNSGREAMDKYQFRGIPFIVAIDKEGRIFRKHLRGKLCVCHCRCIATV
ncbi:MAG: hypothetical protein ACLUVG_08495 [Phocaeicola vulgatus]